jgi:hypothetical protein
MPIFHNSSPTFLVVYCRLCKAKVHSTASESYDDMVQSCRDQGWTIDERGELCPAPHDDHGWAINEDGELCPAYED